MYEVETFHQVQLRMIDGIL